MKVKMTLSTDMVDKPLIREFEFDGEKDAVQLDNGVKVKVKELTGSALEEWFFEKHIKNSPAEGRIIDITFDHGDNDEKV